MSTGVVVVTHNSERYIERCLRSCGTLPVVVVDNASWDETLELINPREVQIIANRKNRGFAAAVNQGVKAVDTEAILLLNPDAELLTGVDAFGRWDVAGGKLLDEAGRPQIGFQVRAFPTPWTLSFEAMGINALWPGNRLNRHYRQLDRDPDNGGPAEQPAGALLYFKRYVWDRVRGFDERYYPVWFEDVDFCKQAARAGFKIGYVPEVQARHAGGHSVSKVPWETREVDWYVSLLGYAFRHFRPGAFRGVSAAVVLGSGLRAIIAVLRQRSLKPVAVYARVICVAGGSLLSGYLERTGPEGR